MLIDGQRQCVQCDKSLNFLFLLFCFAEKIFNFVSCFPAIRAFLQYTTGVQSQGVSKLLYKEYHKTDHRHRHRQDPMKTLLFSIFGFHYTAFEISNGIQRQNIYVLMAQKRGVSPCFSAFFLVACIEGRKIHTQK